MKQLRLSASLCKDDHNNCIVTVVEQTHFLRKFGGLQYKCPPNRENPLYTFVHEGMCLTSYGAASYKRAANEWRLPLDNDVTIRLVESRERIGTAYATFNMPSSEWPRLKRVVAAYNEFYKDKD